MMRPVNRRARLPMTLIGLIAVALVEVSDASEPASPDTRLNLLYIMTDTQRGDAMGCAGHPLLKTPRMDKLASEGVRFSNAFVQAPLCQPARACMMTGRYAHLHRVLDNRCYLPQSEVTWAEILRDDGYATPAVGKTHGIHDGMQWTNVAMAGSWPREVKVYNRGQRPDYGTSPAAVIPGR